MMSSVNLICMCLILIKWAKVVELCPRSCSCPDGRLVFCDSSIAAVPANVPRTTTTLILENNQITNIIAGAFSNLIDLEFLILSNNQIANIEADAFVGLINLRSLNLVGNKISNLEAGVFSGLIDLEVLDLDGNKISNLEAGVFSGLVNLKTLVLSGNKIVSILDGVFSNLSQLRYLYLNNNQITKIEANAFVGLINLEELWLQQNPTACCNFIELIELGKNMNDFRLTCNDFDQNVSYSLFNSSLCSVNGGWSNWTNSTCSATCGIGLMRVTRECNQPAPANGGETCLGIDTKDINCELARCSETCAEEGGMCLHRRIPCKTLITTQKCHKCHYRCCKI